MHKILIVVGSARVKGHTDCLASSFMEGALKAGHQVDKVILNQTIEGCRGCGACQKIHHCVIDDQMQDIYDKFLEADTIVLASPLYFWSISARLKSFIDRLYAISVKDEYPYKETVLLMTSGDDGFYTFQQAMSYYHFLIAALGWKDKGQIFMGDCHDDKQDDNKIREAYQLGLHIYDNEVKKP